uniref:Uncharacterized protein n=1 Tax=viral metagenome TaxID=1070528 RepID=A0A6C0H5Y2_9ZZZZ
MSIPNTNFNFALTHFGKSPAFPHEKSINKSFGFDNSIINLFFTYKL